MRYFLCKTWAYVKYCFLKVNLRYDGLKEPWRFLIGISLVVPCWWGLSAKNYDWRYASIGWLIVLIAFRVIYEGWVHTKILEGCGDK